MTKKEKIRMMDELIRRVGLPMTVFRRGEKFGPFPLGRILHTRTEAYEFIASAPEGEFDVFPEPPPTN